MFLFNTFFWDRLPLYFHMEDTYKDISKRGLLERYLNIFGLELDEDIIPYLDNYLNQVDPRTASDNFLTYIAITLGSPLDIFSNSSKFSLLLQYIVTIYKIKGTSKSYETYFKMLGLDIYLVEHFDNVNIIYDDDVIYDDDSGVILYDSNCEPCSDYSIFFKDSNQPCIPGDLNILQTINPSPGSWVLNLLTLDGSKVVSNTTNSANYARQLGIITPNSLYRVTWVFELSAASGWQGALNLGGNIKQSGGVPPSPVPPGFYDLVTAGTNVFYWASGAGTDLEIQMRRVSGFGSPTAKITITLERVEQISWTYALNDALRLLLEKVICFLQPINARIRDFSEAITVCEDITPIASELVVIQIFQAPSYDSGDLHDETIIYDDDRLISSDYFGDSTLLQYMVATGGTITTVGNEKIHRITSTTNFDVSQLGDIGEGTVLVQGGGGGGGSSPYGTGGGGGGGQTRKVTTLFSKATYLATIGAGGAKGIGASATNGTNGGDSSIAGIVSIGGGYGARGLGGGGSYPGGSGGNGGGGGYDNGVGGSSTVGGYSGGNGNNNSVGGGGGGSAGNGTNGVSIVGGDGGAGVVDTISGSSVEYGAGGDAGDYTNPSLNATAPPANTGQGGDSGQRAGGTSSDGADGSDGVIIVRYQYTT